MDEMDERDIRVSLLLAPVFQRWKAVLLGAVATGVILVVVILVMPRKYEARAVVTTVTSRSSMGLSGGLAASLLGDGNLFGLQAYPPLIVRLVDMNQVLLDVVDAPMSGRDGQRVVDALYAGKHRPAHEQEILDDLSKTITTDYDKPSGLIYLTVATRDSALARSINAHLVSSISSAFLHATQTQASQLREAQEARVDSASRQLKHAEQQYIEFLAANRIVPAYSSASLQRESLQRDVQLAETSYMQAMADKNAAVARELETTPAVVIVDPVPAEIPRVPRHLAAKVIAGEVAYFVLAIVLLLGFDWVMRRRRA